MTDEYTLSYHTGSENTCTGGSWDRIDSIYQLLRELEIFFAMICPTFEPVENICARVGIQELLHTLSGFIPIDGFY